MKKLTVGILAHVDAGKTTLSEALLYRSGRLRALGRVDHKNTYLDTNAVERERGITIFSKQARFSTSGCEFILLDTPGHVDFSAETERTLSLLDYAILVISATDGVQNHTRTLWQLLEFYRVPTLLFINKSDIAIKQKEELARELAASLSPACIPFFEADTKAELDERLAVLDEAFLEQFLAEEPIDCGEIARLIAERRLYPCLFGSALRLFGIDFLLDNATGELFVNEINTIPGSLAFYLWEHSGLSFTELMDEMIRLALKRQRKQSLLHRSFETNLLQSARIGGAKAGKKV